MFHKLLGLAEQHFIHNWEVADATARAALTLAAADVGKVCKQLSPLKWYILTNNVGPVWVDLTAAGAVINFPVCEIVACSDETTALTVGINKLTFDSPFAWSLTSVAAGLNVAQASGSILTIDVKKNGTSIFTTKLTIDNTELTTNTAATPNVLTASPIVVTAWDRFAINIDQVGDGTAKGLKLYLMGTRL